MLLQDHIKRPVGTLLMSILETEMVCKKQTLYFIRNFELKVQSIKRCSSMGSCTGDKCANTPVHKSRNWKCLGNFRDTHFVKVVAVDGAADVDFSQAAAYFIAYLLVR